MWTVLILLVLAGIAWQRLRSRRPSAPSSRAAHYVLRAWALGWWPLPPSATSITRQLIHCACEERLPLARDRFLAPTSITLGLSPTEFSQLRGRIAAVSIAIAESMQENAEDHGWRTQGPPWVAVEPDPDARPGWPSVHANFDPRLSQTTSPNESGGPNLPDAITLSAESATVLSDGQDPQNGPRQGGTAVTHPLIPALHMADGRVVELKAGRTTLGRGPEAQVAVLAPEISRQHFVLEIEGSVTFLEDLGSANGTYVDGHLVAQRTQLRHGSQLRFGLRGPVITYVVTTS